MFIKNYCWYIPSGARNQEVDLFTYSAFYTLICIMCVYESVFMCIYAFIYAFTYAHTYKHEIDWDRYPES